MMRGRKPLPTQMKILAGCPGHRPLPANEPQPQVVMPRCPQHLDATAKKEWKRLAELLSRIKVLTEADTQALAVLCAVWSRWIEAEQKVKDQGMVVSINDGKTLCQNPYLQISNQCIKQLNELLSHFGMTPQSRTRVKTAGDVATDDDDKFFG